jgi:hypothetical protein
LRVPEGGRTAIASVKSPELVVGVWPPQIEVPNSARRHASDVELFYFANAEADRLVSRLAATGLFGEVRLVPNLSRSPDVIITPIVDRNAYEEWENRELWLGYGFLMTYTAGVVPLIYASHKDVRCTRVDRPVPDFHCDWPYIGVADWVALPLLLFDSWNRKPDDEAFLYHLRQCMMARQHDFFALAPRDAPSNATSQPDDTDGAP